jgi:hypothetical protein
MFVNLGAKATHISSTIQQMSPIILHNLLDGWSDFFFRNLDFLFGSSLRLVSVSDFLRFESIHLKLRVDDKVRRM